MDKKFECTICLDTAKEPVLTKCGHMYCWPCIYNWLDSKGGRAKCPNCKNEITKNDLIPVYANDENKENTNRFKNIPKRPKAERNPNTERENFQGVSQKMVKDVISAMEDYDLSAAIDPWLSFIDQLNNWYIRRNRRRFWKSGSDSDKMEAYGTLYSALKTFTQVAAPFIPFLTETMWQNLRTQEDKESVHLCDFPTYNERFRDEALEFQMATVQKAVSMGRSLRNQFNLKNRQPLLSVALVTRNAEEKKVLTDMEDTIKEELNVKEVIFHEREDELVEYKAKANFKVLGKVLGPKMKAAAGEILKLTNEQIAAILDGQKLSITVDGTDVELNTESVIVERFEKEDLKVLNDGTLTVGLDTKITDELKKEGYARDLVRGIQNLRKESGFEVTDRINLTVSGSEEAKSAFEMFKDFISGETLASSAAWASELSGAVKIEADDVTWSVSVKKA